MLIAHSWKSPREALLSPRPRAGSIRDLLSHRYQIFPGGSSLNSEAGWFEWTPGADDLGGHDIELVITDSGLRFGAGQLAEPIKLTAGKKRHALVVLG